MGKRSQHEQEVAKTMGGGKMQGDAETETITESQGVATLESHKT